MSSTPQLSAAPSTSVRDVMHRMLSLGACLAVVLIASSCTLGDRMGTSSVVGAAEDDAVISGVVQGRDGPEAGVWVIAETDDLPTHFIKIVVTDDEGRFMLPEMPDALYEVWVRGYGLVDSNPVSLRVGADVTLNAFVAESPLEAAQIYPANY